MKKFNLGARYATLAVVSATGFLAVAQAAQAQVWFETRGWPSARFYEEGPPVYRDAPRFVAPAILPRRAVRQIVEGQGFEIVGAMQFTGDAYIVQALDERGRVRRLVVDAQDGEIIQSASQVAQPRSPRDMGLGSGPYVVSPGLNLPPDRLAPRSNWSDERSAFPTPPPAVNAQERRARERFARQSPDGFGLPRDRMDDVDITPGFGAAPPAPRSETRKAAPAKPRSVRKPQSKPAPKQQAARRPSTNAQQPAKVEASRPEVLKPEQPKANILAPQVAKPEAAARSNSVLRRPSQKADGGAATGERKGVAAGPTISSGAEPQRKAPRVVYPGPGASAPPVDGQD
jgi:hypothetical protein